MIEGFNNKIGCEIPLNSGKEVSVKSGFAVSKGKTSLLKLKVLFGNANIPAGSFVYVSPSLQHLLNEFEIDGQPFMWIEESQVLFIKRNGYV